MNTEQVAKKVVELVRKQAWYEALDMLYDDDIVSVRRWIRKLHQFQPAFAREYNAPHRFLRLFLLWPDFEPKRRDWQSANRLRAGVTKDQGVPLPASLRG